MNKHIRLLLLSIASVSPLLATDCSTASGTTKQDRSGSYVQIEPRSYTTASRDFDRPWPFWPRIGCAVVGTMNSFVSLLWIRALYCGASPTLGMRAHRILSRYK